jgi:hypothetical protein
MTRHTYHFITRWHIAATLPEINAVLRDATRLPEWWPSVYLAVTELEPGDAQGVGKRIDLYTKGWLPYTLRWQFTVTEVHERTYTLEAHGDFTGRGIWTFEPDGDATWVTYDWRIQANKPLLRNLSFLLKPVFARNHEWAMRQGEISLNRELQRRRLPPEAAQALPPPPGPTPSQPLRWLWAVLRGKR